MLSPIYPQLFDWVKGYHEFPKNGEEDNKYVINQSCGIVI